MAESYYKPCAEFYRCNELIEKYWESKQYDKCFAGHMELAEKGYPLAECQVVKSLLLDGKSRHARRLGRSVQSWFFL